MNHKHFPFGLQIDTIYHEFMKVHFKGKNPSKKPLTPVTQGRVLLKLYEGVEIVKLCFTNILHPHQLEDVVLKEGIIFEGGIRKLMGKFPSNEEGIKLSNLVRSLLKLKSLQESKPVGKLSLFLKKGDIVKSVDIELKRKVTGGSSKGTVLAGFNSSDGYCFTFDHTDTQVKRSIDEPSNEPFNNLQNDIDLVSNSDTNSGTNNHCDHWLEPTDNITKKKKRDENEVVDDSCQEPPTKKVNKLFNNQQDSPDLVSISDTNSGTNNHCDHWLEHTDNFNFQQDLDEHDQKEEFSDSYIALRRKDILNYCKDKLAAPDASSNYGISNNL